MPIIKPPCSATSCIIPVCHGSQDMHGKRFFSYVEEAAKHYTRCHLVVCDTLDVHNMAPSPALWDEALETARAMGDRWLGKHLRFVQEAFAGRLTLTRWDDVKAEQSFSVKYEEAKRLYDQSAEVKAWVDGVCGMYSSIAAQRQRDRGFTPDTHQLFQRSLNYMLEEIAGTSVYFDRFQAPAVYPGQYFDDPMLFERQNPRVSLKVPAQCTVLFEDALSKAA